MSARSSDDTTPSPVSQAPTPQAVNISIAMSLLGIFVAYFPVHAVSVSLTTIASSIGADSAQQQWISTAYVIPMAAAVLSAGLFGDLYGRRRVLVVGAVFTALGAGIAAFAGLLHEGALAMLLVGQAFAGLGGGLLLPITLTLIALVATDARQRAWFIALWAASTGASLALGPIVSGLILQVASWGWIFAPGFVLSTTAVIISVAKLPESRSPEGRSLDIPGQITASLAIIALCYGVIEGGSRGWASAPALIGLVVAVVAAGTFIVVERRTPVPLMNLQMFTIPSFSAANFGGFMALFSNVGVLFVLSVYLGATQQLSALEIGGRIIFVLGVSAVASPFIGRLLGRITAMHMLTAGLFLGALGTFAISGIQADMGFLDLIWRLTIFGIANAMMLTAASVSAISAVPLTAAGMAAATNTALRQLGAALAPAVLGTVYAAVGAQPGGSPTTGVNIAMLITTVLLVLAGAVCLIFGQRTARREPDVVSPAEK